MIIGTITLITMLFLGGVQEYFLLDKLEKGVKTNIEEKDRRKEILGELKEAKGTIKAFHKSRNVKLKRFKKLYVERGITKDSLEKYYQNVHGETVDFQNHIIDQRLDIVKRFSAEEWEKIITTSTSAVEKRLQKAAKKDKDPYASLDKVIEKTISDKEKASKIREIIKDFKVVSQEFNSKINSVNAKDNSILNNQNSTKEELLSVATEINEIRSDAFVTLVDLHFQLEKNTDEGEWIKIMKEVIKTLN